MSFSGHFKEFHEIEIDEHIRRRQHRRQEDAEAFFHVYSDRYAFKFFERETCPGDRLTEAFAKVLDSRIKGFHRKNDYSWVIKYDGEPIGQIRLYDFRTKNTACIIGCILKRAYWNRGINTRCVQGST